MIAQTYDAVQFGSSAKPHRSSPVSVGPAALQTTVGALTHRLGHTVVAELQPIIDAIAASLRGRRFSAERDVSVTLPAPEGKTLVVSVRTANQPFEPPPAGPNRGLDARQLRLVLDTIQDKIDEPISVSMLSSIAGLSRSYFSNAFRSSVGRAPHAHIVRLRVERAMKLMNDAAAPLSEIALAAGFSDQAHFSKKFRSTVGMTPTQWRKTHAGTHVPEPAS